MPTTRIGLAGYGFGGRFFHAPLLAAAPSVEFAGVVTRSPERRAELAHDHPDMPAFDSLADLAAAGAVAVAISTPAPTHIPLALEAIELGLAVVADKPFALDAAQAHTAVEAAEQAGVVLSVYQNRRWDSDLLTVRRLLERGNSARSLCSSPPSNATRPTSRYPPQAAASCATSAATSSTRHCSCSVRWRPPTARCAVPGSSTSASSPCSSTGRA